MNDQYSLFSDNPEYDAFVQKFDRKKTTDDCYTPPEVYAAVKDWACQEYGIDESKIVRPFFPGGDYEHFDYSDGRVVLDNPPFSIITQICEFYLDRHIPFFLFAPSLTAFSGRKVVMRMNHIICDCSVVYDNGAVVRTSFVTSFGGDLIAQTSPELTKIVNDAVDRLRSKAVKNLPKYIYPDNIVTAALMQRYAKYGVHLQIRRGDCASVSRLDAQQAHGKTIFGGGLLLSERAAAERAAAHIWELSPREMEIVRSLSKED